MSDKPEDPAKFSAGRRSRPEEMPRRDFIATVLGGAALATMGLPRGSKADDKIITPCLPCATLVVGGGNTVGMFNALEKNRLLPGGKNWPEFLNKNDNKDNKNGKIVICIGCAAGHIKDGDEENSISIEEWCQKEGKYAAQKGEDFYRKNGAKDVIFIKDAAYNKAHLAEIIDAINDPDTCLFDFAGGDQQLLMKILMDPETSQIAEALKQRWLADPNLLVYTTSASAAALSKYMMNNGEIQKGLGWLDLIIVDMHMHRKYDDGEIESRIKRLQKQVKEYVKKNPDLVGIGVDEATALVLQRVMDRDGAEKMTGTVVAAIDKDGKVRQGSLETNEHNVYVIGERDCEKEEKELRSFKPLIRPDSPPALSINPALLNKLMKGPPERFEKAMKSILSKITQNNIKIALALPPTNISTHR